MNITDDDMMKAIDRLARTEDGHLLYRYLQRVLCATVPPSMPRCALRANEGRRSFAAELMGLMAKGLRESDRSDSAITFTVAGPRRIAPTGGAGRRVTADTRVPGYDTGYDADDNSSPGS